MDEDIEHKKAKRAKKYVIIRELMFKKLKRLSI